MKLQDLYINDIDRKVNPAVSATDLEAETVKVEIEEYVFTKEILKKHPDLDGIVCCNMSNPVGAARAVVETQSTATVVGMDHDIEALQYLNDGVIYCLGVQDCYSIGFDTLLTAVKIADGVEPGKLYPELPDESTTIVYQDDAGAILGMLYGEIQ
jgi:ribose transport system substrate-binding protein